MNKIFHNKSIYTICLIISYIKLYKAFDNEPNVSSNEGQRMGSDRNASESGTMSSYSSNYTDSDNSSASETSSENSSQENIYEISGTENRDRATQTPNLHIKHLDLSLLKETFELKDSVEVLKDEEEDEYPYDILEREINFEDSKTIESNGNGDSEVIISGYDKNLTFKKALSYIDLNESNVSNEELNRVQLGKTNDKYIICDLNTLDFGNLDKNLKYTLSNYNGWVIIKTKTNKGYYKIGATIFGNIGIPLNENIDNRIVSFTINERQQIVKIEEFSNNKKLRVEYFQQTKESIGNKIFKSKRYYILNTHNWTKYDIFNPFYTINYKTFHVLNLNIKKDYNEIFNIECKNNITIFYPNLRKNIYISNVLFGNVKVLFEYNNLYRSVKITETKKTIYIEIFTIDALGRNIHLLYKRKDIINSDNIFIKLNNSKRNLLIYNEFNVLKDAFLIPVNLTIPKKVYKGEFWNMTKTIKTCTCENKFIIETIFANNIEFCTKCSGTRLDLKDDKLPSERQQESLIHFSYKNFNQFGSIYVYLNPRLIYTHRIGDIKIGNVIFPINSIGFVISIKISKYKKNRIVFKFIISENEIYNYKDYLLNPDGETLRLLTNYDIDVIKPNWLSIWSFSKNNTFVDLHLNKNHSKLIRSGFSFENDEVYFYDVELYRIHNVYLDMKMLNSSIPDELTLIRRNVRKIYISDDILITIYSLYLSDKQLPNYKRVIYNVYDKEKYWFINQEHFLLKQDGSIEEVSNEYASCILRKNRGLRQPLNIDLDDTKRINRFGFNIIKTDSFIYYKIRSEISPDIKFGNIKLGGLSFRLCGLYDTIGILIHENLRFANPQFIKKPEKKITFFVHDGYKMMALEYVSIKNTSDLSELINLGSFPLINDSTMSIISRFLDNYITQMKELPFDEAKEQIKNEMEEDTSLLIKLEYSQKYKDISDFPEGTIIYQIISEFTDLLIKEFIEEIRYLNEDEFNNIDTMKHIYYSELNVRNRDFIRLNEIECQ